MGRRSIWTKAEAKTKTIGPHVWAMETGAYVPSREPGLGTEVAVPTDQRAADDVDENYSLGRTHHEILYIAQF